MKKTYYKNLTLTKHQIAIARFIRNLDEAERYYKHWDKMLDEEKRNPNTTKKTIKLTEDIVNRYRTRYVTLLETLDSMGVSRYEKFVD